MCCHIGRNLYTRLASPFAMSGAIAASSASRAHPGAHGRLSRNGDEIVRMRQSLAKSGERHSKILEGLLVYEVQPETEGELPPRVRSSAVQHGVSHQVLKARLLKTRDGLVALKQAKEAGQVEVQTCGSVYWLRLYTST